MIRYGLIILAALVVIMPLLSGRTGDVAGSTLPAPSPTWTRVAPPTPTSVAQPSVTATVTAPDAAHEGAAIWLRVKREATSTHTPETSYWISLWTVVQWQDAAGNWHDVEGWRGPLDEVAKEEGRKVWWLPNHLRGAGPFRWQVYQNASSVLLAESTPFYLPKVGHRLNVEVVVP